MILPLLLLAATAQVGPPASAKDRYANCIELAAREPAAAEAEASRWQLVGGGYLAHQCLGVAYSTEARWSAAAAEFEGAARGAEIAKDKHSAGYWAQAGNAWLASGDPVKARAALDAAIAAGTLTGLQRGEAHIDRARAFVASGALDEARGDLDKALIDTPDDPHTWLLSATLARRMSDLPRAQKDIAEALRRASGDASVQLEAGNVAALAGDEAGAKAAWSAAARLKPGSDIAQHAEDALKQFDTPPAK